MEAPCYPDPAHGGNPDNHYELFGSISPHTSSFDAISDLENIADLIGRDAGIDARKKAYNGSKKAYDFEPRGHLSLCHRRETEKVICGHIGSTHTDASMQSFAGTQPGETGKISRFFKLHPDQPCHTLRAGTASDKGAYTAPRPIHPTIPRCITVREAARLHGFPDWCQFHRTIWHGFWEIGNAVPPLLAKAIGDELIKCLKIKTTDIDTRTLVSGCG